MDHYDGVIKPLLKVTQEIENKPEYYSPRDEINLLVKLENVGSIDAENVLLVVETIGMSGSETLNLIAASDNASIRGDFVAWKLNYYPSRCSSKF